MTTDERPSSVTALDELWAQVPTGPAPVDDILRTGKRVRRRRRTVALIGAAAAVALVAGAAAVVLQSDAETPTTAATPASKLRQIELPTSWDPENNNGMLEARIAGRLVVNDRDCVYLAIGPAPGRNRYWVAWPVGYTATVTTDGNLTIYGLDGTAVARDGDQVEAGGGSFVMNDLAGQFGCVPPGTETAVIMGDVKVASP